MWNYSYIVPTLMVLFIFLGHFFSKPRLPLRINRTFLMILISEIAVILTDVLASNADEHYETLSAALLYLLNMVYFVCYLFLAFLFFRFGANLVRMKGGNAEISDRIGVAVLAVSELITLSSFFTGAVFSITEEGYRRGPLYEILYVCFFSCLALSFLTLIGNRRKLSRWDYYGALLYNGILAAGNVIRFLFPQLLVMNTFFLLATIVIYLSFQNPEFNQVKDERVFNTSAFESILREMTGSQKYAVLAFGIINYNELREMYGRKQMGLVTESIGMYLYKQFHSCKSFYLSRGQFALLGDPKMPMEQMRDEIADRFREPWSIGDGEVSFAIGFVQIMPEELSGASENILNGLNDALERIGITENSNIVMNEENLRLFEQQTEVKRALEYAVEHDKIEVFFQPLVDSHTEQIVGAEALARLRDAEGKLIAPSVFIPIAERNGRINQVGEQVFEKVCRFIRDNDIEKAGLSWINVNVSPIQCMRQDINERFIELLNRYGVPPKWIHLEITEESMIDYILLQKQIEEMEKRGLRFVLDDYGTGYSNVARMKHVPFINVKLDMSLVWDYYHEPDQILPTLVETFKQMNFTVTAEGVESGEMARAMRDIGCDYLQGFHFYKPVPSREFEKMLERLAKENVS